jgi:hypothetical protein
MTVTDLQAANAISDSFFATTADPESIARELVDERRRRVADSILRWRVWIDVNLERTLALTDTEIKGSPGLIAWWFPTGGRSRDDSSAPAISRRVLRAVVSSNPPLRAAMCRAFDRMVGFLGMVEHHGLLHWRDGPRPWATSSRHDRRVYRMLRSIHSAGLEQRTRMLMTFLEQELGGDPNRADALAWYRHQVAS